MKPTDRRPRKAAPPSRNRSPRALPLPPVQWAEPVTYADEIAPVLGDRRSPAARRQGVPPRPDDGPSPARRRQEAGNCRVLNAFRERLD